jgi:HSP20 family protein
MTLVKVNNPLAKSFDGMMKDLFNDLPSAFGKTMREDLLQFPPVNIIEKPNAYQLELAAPGFEKSDFNVKLEGEILTISTEKKEDKTESTDKMVRREFSYRSFRRSFTLDEKIDAENILAKYENGVLKLELPKKEIAKAGVKDISIQ